MLVLPPAPPSRLTTSFFLHEQVCAVGRAQASAVYNTSRISKKLGVPVWADGGIAATGHIVKVG